MAKSVQPSQQEVQEVLQQLREIPCTPQFRLNGEMRAHSQAVLGECARGDCLLERGTADLEGG
ncbi:hypothetical protein ACWATR_36775 [Nostoc sp. UIC 10890]